MTEIAVVSTLRGMQITLTTEQEAQVSELAALEGRGPDEIAREVFNRGLAAEARFLAAVKTGQDAAEAEDFVETAEVWAAVERTLQN